MDYEANSKPVMTDSIVVLQEVVEKFPDKYRIYHTSKGFLAQPEKQCWHCKGEAQGTLGNDWQRGTIESRGFAAQRSLSA